MYKIEQIPITYSLREIQDILNRRESEGWEVVSMFHTAEKGYVIVLRRFGERNSE